MFETSVVRARAQAAGGRLSLLTISLIAHSAVIVGAVAVSIASVDFPTSAPKEFAIAPVFATVRIPPPLGNPNGGARPQQPQVKTAEPQLKPTEPTAPSVIPNDVQPVQQASATTTTGDATGPSTGTVPGPIGVPWGKEGSIGDLDAPPAPVAVQPEERIYEVHEVKAPRPLYKPMPPYPHVMLRTKMRATVVVRCIIDKNGNVRDPHVVVPAMPPFNQAVIETVKTWRYTPGSLGGQAVETYLDVTVNFAVN